MNLEDQVVPKKGPGRVLFWVCLVSAATCAGLVAWAAGEMTLNFFRPTPREIGSGVAAYTPTDNTPYLLAKRRVAIQNAALHYGILGASVGLALGMAGGSLRPSVKNAVACALGGASACGAGAVIASLALVPVFFNYYHHDQPSLLLPVLIRGAIFVVIGSMAGLSLALGLGWKFSAAPMARVALAGATGAVCGAIANEVVYALAFPLARSESPIPSEPASRLLAHLVVAVSIAIGAGWNARKSDLSVASQDRPSPPPVTGDDSR